MIQATERPRTPADEQYGYAFGCDGMVSVKSAMAFLDVGRSTIYRLIDKGSLRKGRIGPTVRICRRSLVNYATSRES